MTQISRGRILGEDPQLSLDNQEVSLADQRINCLKCKHFFVTWNPQSSKGCKAYGFESNQIPSVVVALETKKECLLFQQKEVSALNKNKSGLDLNDDKLWD